MAILPSEAEVFKEQLCLYEDPTERIFYLRRVVAAVGFIPPHLKEGICEIEEQIDQALRSKTFMRQSGAEVQLATCLSNEIKKILRRRYRGWRLAFADISPAGTCIEISPVFL